MLLPYYLLFIISIILFLKTDIRTVRPALRANSCIAIDRLMIESLNFHIPFLSFTNAGFKGYGKNLLNREAENHSTSIDFNTFSPFYFDVIIYTLFVMNHHNSPCAARATPVWDFP